MAKAELKTKKTAASVEKFIDSIEDEGTRADCQRLVTMMKAATGAEPRMWGGSVVGFGDYHYKYPSGREGDWFMTGFSPRKANLTLYFMSGVEPYSELLAKLGRHRRGKGCLYVKSLADLDMKVLTRLVKASTRDLIRSK